MVVCTICLVETIATNDRAPDSPAHTLGAAARGHNISMMRCCWSPPIFGALACTPIWPGCATVQQNALAVLANVGRTYPAEWFRRIFTNTVCRFAFCTMGTGFPATPLDRYRNYAVLPESRGHYGIAG